MQRYKRAPDPTGCSSGARRPQSISLPIVKPPNGACLEFLWKFAGRKMARESRARLFVSGKSVRWVFVIDDECLSELGAQAPT